MKKILKIKNFFNNILLLIRILGKEQKIGLILRIFSVVLNVALPIILAIQQRHLIEIIEEKNNLADLKNVFLIVVLIAFVMFSQKIFSIFFSYINSILNSKMTYSLEKQKYDKCIHVQMKAYDDPRLYDKLIIAGKLGVEVINESIIGIFDFFTYIIQVVSYSVILCRFSIWFMLLPLVASITFLLRGNQSKKYYEFDKNRTKVVRRMNYFHNISTNGKTTKEIKSFGILPYTLKNYRNHYSKWNDEELKYSINVEKKELIWSPIRSVFLFVVPTFALLLYVNEGKVSVSDFTYYSSIVTLCYQSSINIINYFYNTSLNKERIDDYFDFLNLPIENRKGKKVPHEWIEKTPEIQFKNVSFKYDDGEDNVINSVNFILKSGENVAIMGENGAGKTTLIKLLSGLYEPTEGEILINGENIKNYSQESIYDLFSVVFQDYNTYDLPFFELITLGCDNEIDEKNIEQAFKKVGGERVFEKYFKNNLYRCVGQIVEKEGIVLSGGENQKIALARVFLQNRSLVILDEPTSSLDALSELEVLSQFFKYNKNKTTIIISHRMACCAFCDKIIFLKNGKIEEVGSHIELIEKNGQYAQMYKAQAEKYCDK